MVNLDDLMDELEEKEKRSQNNDEVVVPAKLESIDGSYDEDADAGASEDTGLALVGTVEHYFSRINVVAISLSGTIKVGDVIEIKNDRRTVRAIVSSMQINRKEVKSASSGESVGIKIDDPVDEGSRVYVAKSD